MKQLHPLRPIGGGTGTGVVAGPSAEQLAMLEAPDASAPIGDGPTPAQLAALEGPDAEAATAPDAPTREQHSMLESGVRGAVQGATLGFGDEIAGLGKALFGAGKDAVTGDDTNKGGTFSDRYKKERDETRKANAEAQEDNPWTYGLSEAGGGLATSFVPGLGIAKGAQSVLSVAKGAAKLGAVAGAGYSDADNVVDVAKDAAKSGIVGGLTAGALHGVMSGAPKRFVERRVADITDGATATMRDRIAGKAGSNVDHVVDLMDRFKGIAKAGGNTEKALPAVESALDQTMDRINTVFKGAAHETAGIPRFTVEQDIQAIANKLEKDPGKAALARAVRSTLDDVGSAWEGKTHVTAQDLRVLAKDIGDAAFAGSPAVAPKAGKEVAKEVWGALKTRIDQNVDEAADKIGGTGAQELRALNKDASTLINMRQSLQYKATRESSTSTRLKDRLGSAMDMGLAVMHPSALIGKKGLEYVGLPAARMADDGLAKLVTMARNGSTPHQIAQRAIALGLSPMVAKGMSNWLRHSEADLDGVSP